MSIITCELIIRENINLFTQDPRPLINSVDEVGRLMFEKGVSIYNIFITKDIYPNVASSLNKTLAAVNKSVERLIKTWWNAAAEKGDIAKYIGKSDAERPLPNYFIYYMAVYTYLGIPYWEAVERFGKELVYSPMDVYKRLAGERAEGKMDSEEAAE